MLTWPLHCQWHFRKGPGKLHTDTHTHISTNSHCQWEITPCHFTYVQALRSNHTFGNQVLELFSRARIRIYLRRTGLFVLLLSVHHSNHQPTSLFDCFLRYTMQQVKQCALQVFETTACRFPSICPVSPRWLSGPAGIIDHPSAHYHTEWRSHPSYETQDDPEHWISVLGLISCPNWTIVHQRGFCTFHCLLSTDEDAQPLKKKRMLCDAGPMTLSVPIFHSHWIFTEPGRGRIDAHRGAHANTATVTWRVLLFCCSADNNSFHQREINKSAGKQRNVAMRVRWLGWDWGLAGVWCSR